MASYICTLYLVHKTTIIIYTGSYIVLILAWQFTYVAAMQL